MVKPCGGGCGRGKPPPGGRGGGPGSVPQEIFKTCISGDAFWCIFSNKKFFGGGTIHLN